MGGGTLLSRGFRGVLHSLSPRGRGNRRTTGQHLSRRRSIPAWAGEPQGARSLSKVRRVYPRVGGGTLALQHRVVDGDGLSPRGRGNRLRATDAFDMMRSIPAWAGEPRVAGPTLYHNTVYPRVGGGTRIMRRLWDRLRGLSPRGRGNLRGGARDPIASGSIPAWAGEPTRTCPCTHDQRVYPRVGGGTSGRAAIQPVYPGLSPRGRGNPRGHAPSRWSPRSIPAWAGEPPATPSPLKMA